MVIKNASPRHLSFNADEVSWRVRNEEYPYTAAAGSREGLLGKRPRR